MRGSPISKGYVDELVRRGLRPLAKQRDAAALDSFYAQIPSRYPRLFEYLFCFYSWEEVVLGGVELAANLPAADLSGLAASVRYDRHLWEFLVPRGYLIFGRMSAGRYDPCAFDMNRRRASDAPLVRIDHEEVLSFERLGHLSPIASSFKAFLDEILGTANGGSRTRG